VTLPRILVAGVGNIFRGDDAFGVTVVRRLACRPQTEGVRVVDFGTRGHDLAYAILDGYDVVILADTTRRGGEPGTLYVVEPWPPDVDQTIALDATHGVDLPAAFALVRALGGEMPRLYLVGCEPADFGPDDEGRMGLTAPVAGAIDRAAGLVEEVVADVLAGHRRA
jgi:hydrogenase maturation protease